MGKSAVDDGFADHGIFRQFQPILELDLRSDEEGSLVLTLFENIAYRRNSRIANGESRSAEDWVQLQNLTIETRSHQKTQCPIYDP
jgi:hypothetical protein